MVTLEQVRDIAQALEEITGLRSNWSGVLSIQAGAGYNGLKTYHCDIALSERISTRPERWRTVVHELLHACSVGFGPAFPLFVAWEEGPVELLQRMVREEALEAAGIAYDEEAQREAERNHPYNDYVEALQEFADALEKSPRALALRLLGTDMRFRRAEVAMMALDAGQAGAFGTLSARMSRPLR